ncbi:hypothetical protein PVK06_020446 [Gossypium arboreum]|uniref:Uncharacterized protein n=1 Tax=Gossypium arboreum TaxID=29729 RepID=A0ABR0PME0_GOSAR|nr:hypothetical protein PVK06_020446 [Gossypium arboreum]
MLFCEASRDQAVVVSSILETFCYFSGQKVKKSKSQVFFSLNTPSSVIEVICKSVGFSQVDDLKCYLGILLFHYKVTVYTFDFVVSKVRQKLSRWDARKLSLVGRITLVRSVLLAIPNDFIFTVRVPLSVCNKIERLACNFIRETSNNTRKTMFLSWVDYCWPLDSDGLDLRKLCDQKKIFLMKLGYRLLANTESLWVRVLRKKYNMGPLRGILGGSDQPHKTLRVCDLVTENGLWDWGRLTNLVPRAIIQQIAVIILPSDVVGQDCLAWKWIENDGFSDSTT